MRFRHRQVPVPGHNFQVDAGVLDLIVTLNQVPGLKTLFSCQGFLRHGFGEGYVAVAGEGLPFIAFFTEQIRLAHERFESERELALQRVTEIGNARQGNQARWAFAQQGTLPGISRGALRQQPSNHNYDLVSDCARAGMNGPNMSVKLEIDGPGIALRWMTWDYVTVLKMAEAYAASRLCYHRDPYGTAAATPSPRSKNAPGYLPAGFCESCSSACRKLSKSGNLRHTFQDSTTISRTSSGFVVP
jgi:hypothetical protein